MQPLITTRNEADFCEIMANLISRHQKLLFGTSNGNHIRPTHELRYMLTAGGYQFALAEINFMNQKGSGRYTRDPEEAYLLASYVEDKSAVEQWFVVEDCEHTIDSVY